ncbi:MgtC/SapB family protein [Mucilaginibacter sp. HMF5004]|uniref:MgtC/SapB family protein n=1 Tax=Mucilaginibacter rivuli TaxID=2857527 RepID=UPI001C5F2082|nr:MgtC/SapB family protein [Mucilaginibacter rivuli]MBW4889324.1 MgtC/SapB family protein [Mucilaginibacter rivuli]
MYTDEILKIALSAIIGCLVGLEREIRRKPAGFRTLALICVGATIFTICSYKLGLTDNRDRIAANIITGVGFLGAGVIFRNGASVSGITTAATIWIAAALGMLIGIGEYMLALLGLGISLFILYALQFIQNLIDTKFQHRDYTVTYKGDCDATNFKAHIATLKLKTHYFKETRQDHQTTFEFDITGKEIELDVFNDWLKGEEKVYSFRW